MARRLTLGLDVLRLILKLYPRAFRDRFGDDIETTWRRWSEEDRRSAWRMLFDLARNVLPTHVDELRLAWQRPTSKPQRQEATVLDSFLRDLHFAFRRLRRTPAMTGLAAVTLALGIGGTTAIFSLINGVLLHPVSAPHADRLARVHESSADDPVLYLSYDRFRAYQESATSFAALGALIPQSVNVTGGGEPPERIRGMFVSASFFDVLAERPRLGRAIAAGEDEPGGERTAVLSHGFWQRRFGGAEVLGKTIKLNNLDHVIVGVMGPDFRFPVDTTEAWISLHTFPGSLEPGSRRLFTIARLAEGATFAQANEEMAVLAPQLAEQDPEPDREISAVVDSLTEAFAGGRTRQLFAVLVAAVAMVLLIGSANVANLQLAQATRRLREMAIRTAVGASRGRLRGQLLIENLLLSVAGGLLGLAVAYASIDLIVSFGPSWIGGRYAVEPDPMVLTFALLVSLLTGLVFGLAPTRQVSRIDLTEGLQEGGQRQGQGPASNRLRVGLVVAQTALAVMLLIGAGLLLRSLHNLQHVDVGFENEGLLQVQFRLPANKYDTDEKVVLFFDQMLDRVAEVPGVHGVASALDMPFTGDGGRVPVLADGIDAGSDDGSAPQIRANQVSTNYFEVLGIPLLAGRGFDRGDQAGSFLAAVISAEAGNRIWPGVAIGDLVDRSFAIQGDDQRLFRVVGVVGDIYNRGLRNSTEPIIYAHYHQLPSRFATLAARVDGDPHAYAAAIREAIWELDPDQPLWEIMTQTERIAQWTSSDRFIGSLVAVFALVALGLAALGVGGVLAYMVATRRHELGVRMALGADRGQIIRLVLGQSLRMVALGLGLGLIGAWLLRDVLAAWLFGVSALDLAAFGAAPLILALVAILSALGPAWRAAWLDPVRALREE